MATVYFDSQAAGTDSSLLSEFMTRLHTLLIAAGWTLEYADADAIGGGSGSPAWDKTPATNTDAGVAVYRMPANGNLTRWFVRLRPGWAGNTARPHMRGITIGDEHDGNGTVTGNGDEIVSSAASFDTDAFEWQSAVSEDGLLFVAKPSGASANCVFFWVERVRLLDESVQSDVVAVAHYSSSDLLTTVAFVSALGKQSARAYGLGPISISGAFLNTATSYASVAADAVLAVGPHFLVGNPLTGLPRLLRIVSSSDFDPGEDIEVNVDGGLKTYRIMTNSAGMTRLAVATE